MRSSPSSLTRALEPLAAGLWIVFVLVSLAVGAVWIFGLSDAQVARGVTNPGLSQALQWLLRYLDFLWILLAAANTYLCLTAHEKLGTARRWGLIILLSVCAVAWISTKTGYPLGPIQFGRVLGARLGPVPLGLPLFWFTVIIGAREGLLRVFPRWSHLQVALGTAVLAVLTDASLEPLAARLRGFWFWRSGDPTIPPVFDAPLTNCLVWGLVAGLITFALREKNVVAAVRARSWQPAATLLIFHAVFLAAHLGRWVRD
jgi:uncharacterized membrane protein